MKPTDGYYADLYLAAFLRIWITLGCLCIFALVSQGCTRNEDQLSPFRDSAAHDLLGHGEATQTRNRPPHGGCDEKSDSSLTGPIR